MTIVAVLCEKICFFFSILSALFNFKLFPFLFAREFPIIEVRSFFKDAKVRIFLDGLVNEVRFCGIALSTIDPNKVEFIFMLACKQVLLLQFDITLVKHIYPDFRFIVANKSWKIYPVSF